MRVDKELWFAFAEVGDRRVVRGVKEERCCDNDRHADCRNYGRRNRLVKRCSGGGEYRGRGKCVQTGAENKSGSLKKDYLCPGDLHGDEPCGRRDHWIGVTEGVD